MGIKWLLLLAFVAVFYMACEGCGTGAGVASVVGSTPSPTPTSPPTPPPKHLYLSLYPAYQGGPGGLDVFSLPITSASTPVATVNSPGGGAAPLGLAIDSSDRLFGSTYNYVEVYALPIVNGATPAFTANIEGIPMVFDGVGDLFDGSALGTGACGFGGVYSTPFINEVYPPITSSSVPNVHITEPEVCNGPAVVGLALDHGGNLWAAIEGRLDKFSPPFTNSSVPALSISMCAYGLGFDSVGNMYVRGCDGLDVCRPPFGPSMKKAYTITSTGVGNEVTGSITFDAAGNMYLMGGRGATCVDPCPLLMYSPPFGGGSQPAVTISGSFWDVALGQ